ncbi:uncharacterized protein LOC123544018 isoform X2 [Mercenaria mercenaria]|uniref:uncharacterized protein LOC123544018 isoform X2 n=1 Tax=Mercenaria mercenaria TaxID=6596 RepID=UPI00234E96C3|nr:uncharacterized protein LOC123544018 isoform X2 [Mercenaria mercenaria]
MYYRPCQACGVAAVFEGQSKCLLNLGTYLVGYDVLRSYMHSFLHGRRPMYTFYQTWCDIHLDYGNSKIQEEFSYQKFRHAWHTFLSLLDIDYNEGFSCPDCGDDGPDTVICDGTSLSFQRRMWNWGDDSEESEKKLSSASFSDRIFLEDAVTRNLLKRFTADSVRGVKLKPLHELEKHKLLASLKQKSKPLFNIINEIDGDPALLPIYRKFLFSLASPSPVCSFIRPSESVESLIKAIVSGINIREEPLMWKSIHSSIPVVFEVFENQGFTDDMKLLLRELWNIAVLPFISAQEDVEKTTVTYHPDDELSFFPSLLKYRNRGHFEKDVSRVKRNEQCSKKYAGHPSLLPGVFTLFCPHGICYGFQVMASNESPNVPFTILRTRFKQAPRRVIYDNACKLQEYCLNRDPLFFKDTEFYVDRLHWDNHTSCSYGYNLSLYPELENLNSQCNEQANAGLKRIKDQLSYMTASNFMTHCAFYLRHKNMCKLKLYAFDEVITGEKISFAK